MSTKIEYLDEEINPIQTVLKGKCGHGYHCTKISAGCKNCWAEKFNNRFGNHIPFDDRRIEYEIVEKQLLKPTHWRIPRLIGVQFMGDLFHPGIPTELVDQVFAMMTHPMIGGNHHTYLILTKRPERILEGHYEHFAHWSNIWLGVSVENQRTANERIPFLLKIPAKTKFVSIEPILEEIKLSQSWRDFLNGWDSNPHVIRGDRWGNPNEIEPEQFQTPKLDWVIIGAESGIGVRPMQIDWVRGIKRQCVIANVPLFIKQLQINGRIENDIAKFPADLRIREYPK